jgi:hypothetical protein
MRRLSRRPQSIPKKYLYQNKFDGGLNLFISDVHVKESESPDLLNCQPEEDGIISTRYGYSKFGNASGTRTRGMGFLKMDDGSKYLIRADGSTTLKVYNTTTDNWDAASGFTYTPDLQTDFCQAGNLMFIQNGTDNMTHFDGSVVAEQTNGQKGAYSIYFQGSLITWGNPDSPHRLYISGIGANVGDFSAGNGGQYIDIAKSDGNPISSCSKKGKAGTNILLIYKNGRATYQLYFDASGLPVVETISPNRGAVNHRSVDNMEDDVVILTKLPAVMAQGEVSGYFDQIRTNELSLLINPELETVNQSRLDQVAAIYYKHRYYLAYSESGQTYNNKILMYDRRYNSWWKWDNIRANCFMIYEDSNNVEHFLWGDDNSGQVYEFDHSRNDDETAINSYFTTKAFNADKFDIQKTFYYVDILFRNVSGTVTLQAIIDGQTITKEASVGVTGDIAGLGASLIGDWMFGDDGIDTVTTNQNVTQPKRIMVRKKARTLKVKISTSALNSYFSLLDLSLAYKLKSPRKFDSEHVIR